MLIQFPLQGVPKKIAGYLCNIRFWGGFAFTMAIVIATSPLWGAALIGTSLALHDLAPDSLWGGSAALIVFFSIPVLSGIVAGAITGVGLCQGRPKLLFLGVALPALTFIIEQVVIFAIPC